MEDAEIAGVLPEGLQESVRSRGYTLAARDV